MHNRLMMTELTNDCSKVGRDVFYQSPVNQDVRPAGHPFAVMYRFL